MGGVWVQAERQTARRIFLRDGAILLVAALIFRAATFRDPNLHVDETFYFLVGQAMHHGAVPYIDIWDRKPLGLFVIYWAIAGLSTQVIAYQLVATGFATATALVLAQIARRWVGGWAPVMAGIGYLAMLNPLNGMGGQSPVFYNLLIAGAALQLVSTWASDDIAAFRRRYLIAMMLCGLALTIKQTTLFEGVFFGLAGLWRMHRQGARARQLLLTALAAMAIAALPTVGIGAWYYANGWWPQWWNAMVTSNLRRQGIGFASIEHNIWAIFRLILVFLFTAVAGLVFHRRSASLRPYRALMLGWFAVALLGFVAMPNFFDHYALPLLVPLTPLAALGLTDRLIGPLLLAANLVVASILGTTFSFANHRASLESFEHMKTLIERYRGDRPLLILHGPLLLYPATRSPIVSPLVFPEHLINRLETNVSEFDTLAEIRRILAARPAVVIQPAVYDLPARDGRIEMIATYLKASCHRVGQADIHEIRDIVRRDYVYACR